MRTPDPATLATGATLGAIGVLHVAWGRGSTWPFADTAALTEEVVGRPVSPSPGACYAVAGLLGAAATLVAGPGVGRTRIRAAGQLGVAAVLGARAALGFAGRTDLVSPGSTSATFRRNDRRRYSPLCTALALGATRAARRTWSQGRVA